MKSICSGENQRKATSILECIPKKMTDFIAIKITSKSDNKINDEEDFGNHVF